MASFDFARPSTGFATLRTNGFGKPSVVLSTLKGFTD